jgi:hypothetical protein
VVVVGDTVYWSYVGYVHGTSAQCPGIVQSAYDNYRVDAFALLTQAGSIFWADGNSGGGGVYGITLGSTSATALMAKAAFEIGGFTSTATQLIWTDSVGGSIQAIPVAGGNVTTQSVTFPTGSSGPGAVASDGSNIYWADWNGASWSTVQTMMVRKMTGVGTTSVLATDQGSISSMATDGQDVFWVSTTGTRPDLASHVRKVSIGGSPVINLADLPASQGVYLALDGNDVFWTAAAITVPGGSVTGVGAVSKVAKDGSTQSTPLVSGLVYPSGVYLTPQFVYWAEFASPTAGQGRIMRVRK